MSFSSLVKKKEEHPAQKPTCGGRMEGICRLGGATCTWAAAGCPAIALGTTGSKRDPADTQQAVSLHSAASRGEVRSSMQDPAGTVSS